MAENSKPEGFDASEILDKIDGVLRHLENVRENTELMGKRLIQRGEVEIGTALICAGRIHDISKLKGIEFEGLTQDSNKELLKLAIKHHTATNSHHVEFWGKIEEMPRLQIYELVADCAARSQEFGTDIREYIKDEFMPKHGLTNNCRAHKWIKEGLDLLLEKPFKKL